MKALWADAAIQSAWDERHATKIEIGLAQGNLQFSEWMLTGFGAM